ncbi:LpqN/LpqT family lipoprotein [Aldersonia sp. NBC_00410]|uniref:LpqN/LpqT family lipoprotein n=1 Tax=Aldersonia sp. NBC_00410 TaxID=2975954 RepID=UPI002252A609|nr:LpqN/LpqT family lipoprotein [Aldersonia sp. NBC_00410]MCX5045048.1 LpqN/LpqT family lipoprotein [Aldersonia sp. NBC_00410]
MNDVSAVPETLAEYMRAQSQEMSPVRQGDERVIASLLLPADWVQIGTEIAPDAYLIVADPASAENGFAPNAVVLITRAAFFGNLDMALSMAFQDASQLPSWTTLSEERGLHQGHRSACIRGTYRLQEHSLFTENRYVLATQDHWVYLVQATYTTTTRIGPPAESIVDTLHIDLIGRS